MADIDPRLARQSRPDDQLRPDDPTRINPSIDKVVESAIYSTELPLMERFYSEVLEFRLIDKEEGRHVFFQVGAGSILLIFNPETTIHGHHLPAHGAIGPSHVAFGINNQSLDSWRTRLTRQGIRIEHEQSWPRGGHSLYFRDPAGNSIELITPGVWGTPSGW